MSFSTAYHSQTDGQTERLNRILEDVLRACILNFDGSWKDHLHLVEFSYNNSYQASIKMAPYEALYGRPCRSPSYCIESEDCLILGRPNLIRKASAMVELIKKGIKATQNRQKRYADKRRRNLKFKVGDLVFVKISPIKVAIRFGKTGKLAPRYIGPFRVLERIDALAYRIELPERMAGIHNVFHVSHLRKYVYDPSLVVEPTVQEDLEVEPDLTAVRHPVQIVDRDEKEFRNKVVKLVKVQWSEDHRDCIWKTLDSTRKAYPELCQDN